MNEAGAVGSGAERWVFDAIGTRWEIETASPLSEVVQAQVTAVIEDFDRAWSRFRPDSLVAVLARGARAVPAPIDTVPMLDLLAEASTATQGAINPLLGDALASLGYDAEYSFSAGEPRPAPRDWRARLAWDARRLSLRGGGMLDIGALGKGRLVDRVLNIVGAAVGTAEPGVVRPGNLVVDASGDLAVRGAPVRVGLEHPFDSARAIGVWSVQNQALCASAVGRRAWGNGLHHVLDARTGAPTRHVVATWAVADEAMRADAAATALFFEGGAELAHRWGVPWVRMLSSGRVEFSPGCTAELFAADRAADPASVET